MGSYLDKISKELNDIYTIKDRKDELNNIQIQKSIILFINMYYSNLYLKTDSNMYLYAKKKMLKSFFKIEYVYINSYFLDKGIELNVKYKYDNIEVFLKDLERNEIDFSSESNPSIYNNIVRSLINTYDKNRTRRNDLITLMLDHTLKDEISYTELISRSLNTLSLKLSKYKIKIHQNKIFNLNGKYIVVLIINFKPYPFVFDSLFLDFKYLFSITDNYRINMKKSGDSIEYISNILNKNLILSFINLESINNKEVIEKIYDVELDKSTYFNSLSYNLSEVDLENKLNKLLKINFISKLKR